MPPSKPTKRDESTPPVKPTGAAALPNSATGGEVEVPRLPQIQLLRGMKDLLPSEQAYWDRVRTLAASIARTYGYARIDTPILEDIDLFMRAVGKGTDIIEKEMFA
ncbi:ATP phosphoribosyltransferase regulatory subunit, partial [Candidatus Uhrbacteria bacterium]|nr:ATP phosphoribosyltransferase regulatory subunit [Candidatus Uhrbacteria bacterium]